PRFLASLPRMNLALIFEALAAAYPDRESIVTPTRRLTYGRLAEHARRLASVLHAHGLGCRIERTALENHESGQDHVGLCLLNSPEYLEAMLGAYRARVAPFNVNYRYVDDELLYLLQDADAAGLVYHARYAPTLGRIRDRLPRLRLLLQVDDGSGEPLLPGALEYAAALAAASPAGPPVACSPDDLYILYTGGTTGAPKGVLWRQEDIYFGAMSGQPPGVPPPATLPELVERAANGAYLRTLPTPPLMHGAAEWGASAALRQGGASETGGHGAMSTRAGDEARTGTFAMADTVVLREDLSGELPPGSPDVGWVARTRHVPLGYYKDAAKTARTFPIVGGTRYAVPGDHGRILADRSIVVLGRGSVSINTGGEKVYPEEVEQALRRHPSIYDAVVVGTPDERFGEQVTAVVQLRPGAHAGATDEVRPPRRRLCARPVQHAEGWRLHRCGGIRRSSDARRARTPHAALASPAAARQSRVLLSLHARVWLRPETRVSGRGP